MATPRLIYGFLSQSSNPYGMELPWRTSDRDGNFASTYTLEDSVRTNLIFWAKTNWGEIPYKFRFGLDARRYLFDPVSVMKNRIEENARSQLAQYFPFFKVTELQVISYEDDDTIQENSIIFKLRGLVKEKEFSEISLEIEVNP